LPTDTAPDELGFIESTALLVITRNATWTATGYAAIHSVGPLIDTLNTAFGVSAFTSNSEGWRWWLEFKIAEDIGKSDNPSAISNYWTFI
jgi:hypothetical protein